eukprot:Skav221498  [mRNA]  locus=scaffold2743:20131:22946:- [translate_table: standard]
MDLAGPLGSGAEDDSGHGVATSSAVTDIALRSFDADASRKLTAEMPAARWGPEFRRDHEVNMSSHPSVHQPGRTSGTRSKCLAAASPPPSLELFWALMALANMEFVKQTAVPEVAEFQDPHVPPPMEVGLRTDGRAAEPDEFDMFENDLQLVLLERKKEERQMLDLLK